MKKSFFLLVIFSLSLQDLYASAITTCLSRIKKTLSRSHQFSLDLDKDFKKLLSEIRQEYLTKPHRLYESSGGIQKGSKIGVYNKVYQFEYFLGAGAEGENYVVRELIDGKLGDKKVIKIFREEAAKFQKDNIEKMKAWKGRGIPIIEVEEYSPLQKLAVLNYREGVSIEYLLQHPQIPDFRKQQLRHLLDVMYRKTGGDINSLNVILDIKNGELVAIDAI